MKLSVYFKGSKLLYFKLHIAKKKKKLHIALQEPKIATWDI